MLNENIKKLRKSKGLSQEELAIKLNVVRQTVSKWDIYLVMCVYSACIYCTCGYTKFLSKVGL